MNDGVTFADFKPAIYIVEDDALGVRKLQRYLNALTPWQAAAVCKDAAAARKALAAAEENSILFLDIELGAANGIELLAATPSRCAVIVTSSYNSYALDAYELGVVDYLVKPFNEARLEQALYRAVRFLTLPAAPKLQKDTSIWIRTGGKARAIAESSILYTEAKDDRVLIMLNNGAAITANMTLSEFLLLLTPGLFLRIHKSYSVRVDRIVSYSAAAIELPACTLPIGRHYRMEVRERFATSAL